MLESLRTLTEMVLLLESLAKPNSQVLVIEHSSSTEEPQPMPEQITVGLEKSAMPCVLKLEQKYLAAQN
jgi:hypothetical protein